MLAGLALVAVTIRSAITTVVLPRGVPSVLVQAIFSTTQHAIRTLARRMDSFERRDAAMAMLAPIGLLLLPVTWIIAVTVGYTMIFIGVGDHSIQAGFELSGSSLLTLGFERPPSGLQTVLAFSEATIGLGLIALLIAYLPTMYASFSRREAAVALLEVRAGSPPSAVEMLVRFQNIGWSDRLDVLWDQWEQWFADIEETHTSLPAVAYFRSPQPERHWVTAAGAVLDAAALRASTIESDEPSPRAQLCLRAGFLSLRHIAELFGIAYDADPAPDDPISISRAEFDTACEQLATAGVPLRPDRDQAWRDFAGWRVNYDTVLLALATLTMAPPARWSSDRSPPYRRTRILTPTARLTRLGRAR